MNKLTKSLRQLKKNFSLHGFKPNLFKIRRDDADKFRWEGYVEATTKIGRNGRAYTKPGLQKELK